MDGGIQMLNRFPAMAIEVVFGGLQLMLGITHRLKSLIDVRMPVGSRNWNCWSRQSSGWGCRSGRSLRSGCRRRKCKREE